jgi:hypothetical protein
MKIKGPFLEFLKREQFAPEFLKDRKPKKRVRKFIERTGKIALGAGLFVALQTTWAVAYDKHTRAVLQSDYRVEEVYSSDEDGIDIVPFLAYTILTTTGSQTWNIPADFNPVNNLVECIGCGANGAAGGNRSGTTGGAGGRGGGGGAYARKANINLTPGGTASYFIATGNSAADTWFHSTGTVLADGANGQIGGQASGSVGDTCFDGGDGAASGGGGTNTSGGGGRGGGGAAGFSGAGSNGSAGGNGTSGNGSNGGNGGNGGAGAGPNGGGAGTSGGNGAAGNTGNTGTAGGSGSNGSYYDGAAGTGGGGKGGGGGGNGNPVTQPPGSGGAGGAGGFYGGGGGGGGGAGGLGTSSGQTGGAAGAGRQGLIIISWTPNPIQPSRSYIIC